MTRRYLLALLVALLASVAGCSVLGGAGPGSQDSPTETLTPVAIGTESNTAERAGSGTSDGSGISGRIATRLDGLYGEQLANTTYRVTSRLRFLTDDGQVGRVTLTRRIGADGRTHVERYTAQGMLAPGGGRFTYVKFYNGSIRATRYATTQRSNVTYGYTASPRAPAADLSGRTRFERLLMAYEYNATITSETGTVLLRGERIVLPSVLSTPAPAGGAVNGSFLAEIGPGGTITARATYGARIGTDPDGTLVQTYRIDRLGAAAVGPPDWIPVAHTRADTDSRDGGETGSDGAVGLSDRK
ncbi:MAG: hypothetical protein ABEH56_00900 [Salinirussus sp.]